MKQDQSPMQPDSAHAFSSDVLWSPDDAQCRASGLSSYLQWLKTINGQNFDSYRDLWSWSVTDVAGFWASLDQFERLGLSQTSDAVLLEEKMPGARWFNGSHVNYARRVLDGGADVDADLALICLGEDDARREITRGRLRAEVASFAAALRGWGVKNGDRVVGYLANTEEAIIGFLATASIGAIWSVCSPEFGAAAVLNRFQQLQPKVLLGVGQYRYGGKIRDRSAELREIIEGLPSLQRVVTVGEATRPIAGPPMTDWTSEVGRTARLEFDDVDFSHPLWVLFSSGTTGRPKGIVHSHGGIVVEHLKLLRLHFDVRAGDRFLFVGSTSWMVWNLMVSGLLLRAALVVLDGSPGYPNIDRVWQATATEGVNVLGLGAGLIGASMKAARSPRDALDLSALRSMHVTGSPLSSDGFRWVYEHVQPNIWLASASGGTDICSAFVGGVPTLPVRAGRIQRPCLGVAAAAWDPTGQPVVGTPGELVVTKPMPSMPLHFWGDDDGARYSESYFQMYPGVWRHGDFIEFDEDLSSVIHGRSDSTLNRNGVRMGSADIYSAIDHLPDVLDALVVGAELGGQYFVPLFVHLAADADPPAAVERIKDAIRSALSTRHLPDEIVVMPSIPYNRTGKKLEVPVKRMLQGAPLTEVVDAGTVGDLEVLRHYETFARRLEHISEPQSPQLPVSPKINGTMKESPCA